MIRYLRDSYVGGALGLFLAVAGLLIGAVLDRRTIGPYTMSTLVILLGISVVLAATGIRRLRREIR